MSESYRNIFKQSIRCRNGWVGVTRWICKVIEWNCFELTSGEFAFFVQIEAHVLFKKFHVATLASFLRFCYHDKGILESSSTSNPNALYFNRQIKISPLATLA